MTQSSSGEGRGATAYLHREKGRTKDYRVALVPPAGARPDLRLDSPAVILHRGAHAADRARGYSRSRYRSHACAGRCRGATGRKGPGDRLSIDLVTRAHRLPVEGPGGGPARAWICRG